MRCTSQANGNDAYRSCLDLDIEQLGRDLEEELESDWMVPLFIETKSDRLMVWHLQLIAAQRENWKSEVNQPFNLLP